jgi:hypothetical protein
MVVKQQSPLLAVLAAVLAAPALVFVTSSILQYELGLIQIGGALDALLGAIDSPFILLGGLAAALFLTLAPLTTLSLRREGDRVTGSISVTVRWWSLAIAALSLGLLAVLFAYAFVENLAPIG